MQIRLPRLFAMLLLLAVTMIAQSAGACAQNRVRAGNLTISPEDEWTAKTSGLPNGAVLALLSPDDLDGFNPNLNVVIQTLPDGTTASDLLEQSRREIESTGGKVESTAALEIDGRPGGRVIWTTVIQGRHIKLHSTFLVSEGKAYLITGTTLEDSYRRYEASFSKMVNSVRFVTK